LFYFSASEEMDGENETHNILFRAKLIIYKLYISKKNVNLEWYISLQKHIILHIVLSTVDIINNIGVIFFDD
jgi:hypothetical protein